MMWIASCGLLPWCGPRPRPSPGNRGRRHWYGVSLPEPAPQ
ncbi:hypothetical protein B005_2814 [Nocardiopsis alba ATCC BAA-2165]|uniref:Uncharacterized protein n=1 Tax=Nocardiopsis alba (strain ATCC BAA-2165 / BE74) TaxID=1205910 RepID=J7L6I4_NOCAA|nr:hypothetical protein B005_2814 [Nocardiopsis alba ATCC BAA-2165]